MEFFKQYIKTRGHGIPASESELRALLKAHPWFSTARLVQRGVQAPMPIAEAADRRPEAGKDLNETEFDPRIAAEQLSEADLAAAIELQTPAVDPLEERIIEQFLEGGEHRITPGDAEPEAPVVQTDQGLVSETLARIYFDQELWEPARAAYAKLSLAYPEKSSYFAEIIADIDARSSAETERNS